MPVLLLWCCQPRSGIPLGQAARQGDTKTIEAFLSHGADPNQKDAAGLTALMVSARAGALPAVEFLRRHGADPKLPGGCNGWTPLMHAVHENPLAAAKALFNGGAQVHCRGWGRP